jgi:hypothetical protein
MTDITLSDYQQRICLIPEEYDVFLGGGRGAAKSFGTAILALRHCEQYGSRARVLYIRQTYKGLADFENITREMFGALYGTKARYNSTEHIWRMPNDGYIELGQLESAKDYTKYQGRSFTLLIVDEAGQYATPELIDRLRSNLRGPKDMPIRIAMAGNPGGVGHHWIAKRYVFKSSPWKPFHEDSSGRKWVYAPGTFTGNPFIDQEQYYNQLKASCPNDPELLRAWVEGDWSVSRGAYFASVMDEKRNALNPIETIPMQDEQWNKKPEKWAHWLAHDYGSSAPSVTYVMIQSPGAELNGIYYPKDSILVIDELATSDPIALNQGLGYTVPHQAELIKEMCSKWGIRPAGVADDAIFSKYGSASGSIADEFTKAGVFFRRAKKADRKTGWEAMRRMFQDAGKPDKPGLYVSRSCEYFWATVPYIGRDPRNAEDVDTRSVDHAADAIRYGLNGTPIKPVMPRMISY